MFSKLVVKNLIIKPINKMLVRKKNLLPYPDFIFNTAIHEAGHSAFIIKNKTYSFFDYAQIYHPTSKKFQEGIEGVTCFDPQLAYNFALKQRNEFFIKFHLIGKLAQTMFNIPNQNQRKDNASDDVFLILEDLREMRHNQIKALLTQEQLKNLTEITTSEENFLNEKIAELLEFITNNQKLISILTTMLLINKKVEISDIWDIYLNNKIELPDDFLQEVSKQEIDISPIERVFNEPLFLPDYENLSFRELFDNEITKVKNHEEAMNVDLNLNKSLSCSLPQENHLSFSN